MEVEEAGSKTLSIYEHLSPEEKVELLFRQYYAGLCKSLYRTLRDASLAEDIVQEVFVKVWDMRHSLRLDEAIPAYLYRSCYHAALNFLKSRKPLTDLSSLEDLAAGSQWWNCQHSKVRAVSLLMVRSKRPSWIANGRARN